MGPKAPPTRPTGPKALPPGPPGGTSVARASVASHALRDHPLGAMGHGGGGALSAELIRYLSIGDLAVNGTVNDED